MAGTELAKAYVQIVPSAKGIAGSIKSTLAPEATSAGTAAGESIASNLVSKLKGLIAAAGIGTAIKKSLDLGGELQQNLGGTEAVFGDFATKVQSKATEAYKNMGMSASDYMATANKMGSLFQGSGLKQERALKLTTSAMQRAADVASVMGLDTSAAMESIAGAAKGNFTMMDNLGVAMNATTLEAYALEKGINFKWNTASNAEKAELAMKMFMDRTKQYEGNFAKESNETFSGSLGAMKAAAQDFMGNLSLGMDISGPLQNMISTTGTFVFGNLLPMIGNIATAIPGVVHTAFTTVGPIISEQANGLIQNVLTFFRSDGLSEMTSAGMDMVGGFLESFNYYAPAYLQEGADIVQAVVGGIIQNLPAMAESALGVASNFVIGVAQNIPWFMQTGYDLILSLVNGVMQAAPQLITSGFNAAVNLVNGILPMLPSIMTTGFQMLSTLAKGVISNMPAIISAAAQGVARFVAAVGQNLPQILSTGIQLLGKLVAGIIQAIPQIPGAVSRIVSTIRQGFQGIDWGSIGRNIISGIASGISGAAGAIVSAARSAAQSALNAAKSFLGIKSPSRVFRDQVGYQIIAGWTAGITENRNKVLDAVTGIADDSYKIPNRDLNGFIMDDRSGRLSSTNNRVVELLEMIAGKDTSLVIGNKEFKRTLDDFGVAYV